MHHLTVLAAAFSLSGDEHYATRVASHLRSWWAQNPFLSGVHWTSGIEAGLRLVSWVWVRRLLDGWAGAAELFERNEVARAQIWWHQHYLASFRSRGSSANNHVIAEAVGLLVGALAFDLVRGESSLGRRGRTGSRTRAEEQYLPQRRQSRDGLRLPRLRHRVGGGCGSRGELGGPPSFPRISGPSSIACSTSSLRRWM